MKKDRNNEMLAELVKLTARLDQKPPGSMVTSQDRIWAREVDDGNHVGGRETAAIRIYQYFEGDTAGAELEEGVIPLPVHPGKDCDVHHKISLDVGEEMKRSGVGMWGLFSSQLQDETGLKVSAIRAIVEKKSGYDAYVVHTDPSAECLSENPWIHGEYEIGGFLRLISKLADQLGIDLGDLKSVHPRNGFLYGNHVIGTAKFWRLYNGFVSRANGEFMATLELDGMGSDQWSSSRNRPEIGKLVTAYQKRLVLLFMSGVGKGLKVLKINPVQEKSAEREWLDIAGYLRDRYLSEMSQETRNYWLKVRDLCRNQRICDSQEK